MVDMYQSTLVVFEGSKARWMVGRLSDVIGRRLKPEGNRAIYRLVITGTVYQTCMKQTERGGKMGVQKDVLRGNEINKFYE